MLTNFSFSRFSSSTPHEGILISNKYQTCSDFFTSIVKFPPSINKSDTRLPMSREGGQGQ